MCIRRQSRKPVPVVVQRRLDKREYIDLGFDLRRSVVAPRDIEADRDGEEEKIYARIAASAEWIRPGEFSVYVNAHQLVGAVAQSESRIEIRHKVERIELNEQIVTKEAVDVQTTA